MKLPLSKEMKDMLRRTALMTAALVFAAHAFCFFNLTYSGASVMLNVSKLRSAQIAGGQFLAPIYFQLRGALSAPMWVGLLSTLCLTLTAMLCAWLLRLEKPAHLFILCGALCANAAVTSVFAASLHTADAALLALLLGALAAACCLRVRFGCVPGAALLAAAMALDPGSLAFFVALFLIAWLGGLLADSGEKPLFSAVQALLCAAAGLALWLAGALLMARRNGIDLTLALHMPEGGLAGAYLAPLRALAAPLTAYPALSVLLRALLALAAIAAFAMQAREAGFRRALPAALAALLVPLACALPLFYLPQAQQITPAYCLLDLLVLVLLARLTAPRLRAAACAAFGVLFLGGVVFSNQVYLKKNLEFESTLSLSSRIIHRLEETEGYQPGYTPVAVIGTMEDSVFSVPRRGFEHLAALDAAKPNYAVTSSEEMIWYCWEVLGYPSNFVSTFEASQLAAHPAVAAMPAFPAEGCCAFVDGVLVIRLH